MSESTIEKNSGKELKLTILSAVAFIVLILVTMFVCNSSIFYEWYYPLIEVILIVAPIVCMFTVPDENMSVIISAVITFLALLLDVYMYFYANYAAVLYFKPEFDLSTDESKKLLESYIPRSGIIVLCNKKPSNFDALPGIVEFVKKNKNATAAAEIKKEIEEAIKANKSICLAGKGNGVVVDLGSGASLEDLKKIMSINEVEKPTAKAAASNPIDKNSSDQQSPPKVEASNRGAATVSD